MFDIGWMELLLIGVVALIVVGPKELPVLFRTVGRYMGKARGMAREFQRSMEQAADETGLKEASLARLRRILMTGLTTAVGAMPLIFTHGAGAETRMAIGIVVFFGALASVTVALLVVPAAYSLLARRTGSPGDVARKLEAESEALAQPAE